MIVCALIPLFKQFMQLPLFWKVNKYDFFIYLVTWAGVVFLDITPGLGVGVVFSIITVAYQACRSKGMELTTLGHIDLQSASGSHETSNEIAGVKIFRFDADLHFASQGRFKQQLFKHVASPQNLRLQRGSQSADDKAQNDVNKNTKDDTVKNGVSDTYTTNPDADNENQNVSLVPQLHTIILDCSSITYIDIMGFNLIKILKGDYAQVGVSLVLASCSAALVSKLEAAGIGENPGEEGCKVAIYPTIQDAIVASASSADGSINQSSV